MSASGLRPKPSTRSTSTWRSCSKSPMLAMRWRGRPVERAATRSASLQRSPVASRFRMRVFTGRSVTGLSSVKRWRFVSMAWPGYRHARAAASRARIALERLAAADTGQRVKTLYARLRAAGGACGDSAVPGCGKLCIATGHAFGQHVVNQTDSVRAEAAVLRAKAAGDDDVDDFGQREQACKLGAGIVIAFV